MICDLDSEVNGGFLDEGVSILRGLSMCTATAGTSVFGFCTLLEILGWCAAARCPQLPQGVGVAVHK